MKIYGIGNDRRFMDGEAAFEIAKRSGNCLVEYVSHDGEFTTSKLWPYYEVQDAKSIFELTDPRITLQDLVETIEPENEPFKSFLWYNEDGDLLEYCFSPESSYAVQLLPFLTVFYGQESKEITAFQIDGATGFVFENLRKKLANGLNVYSPFITEKLRDLIELLGRKND